MRELTYYVATSLDGFIAAPDHTFADFETGGEHFDEIYRSWPETLPTDAAAALGLKVERPRFDTVLMGWNTYAVGLPFGVASPYRHLRQFVFSRRDRKVPDGVTLTAEDPVAVVRRLKAETSGAGIWLCGGGQLASQLVDEIDRLVLKVNPVLFGAGIPLFASRPYGARRFALVSSKPYKSHVVINEYRRRA